MGHSVTSEENIIFVFGNKEGEGENSHIGTLKTTTKKRTKIKLFEQSIIYYIILMKY